MHPTHFLTRLSDDAITSAIRHAESRTSGEIRVFITRKRIQDPLPAAQAHFTRLKMHHTKDRNAVLIFIAPASQTYAIVGDTAVHARCGQSFWNDVAAEMHTRFAAGHLTEALTHAIQKAGDLLAQHFPPNPNDTNELPDQVERD